MSCVMTDQTQAFKGSSGIQKSTLNMYTTVQDPKDRKCGKLRRRFELFIIWWCVINLILDLSYFQEKNMFLDPIGNFVPIMKIWVNT